jgi:hypothetical protein
MHFEDHDIFRFNLAFCFSIVWQKRLWTKSQTLNLVGKIVMNQWSGGNLVIYEEANEENNDLRFTIFVLPTSLLVYLNSFFPPKISRTQFLQPRLRRKHLMFKVNLLFVPRFLVYLILVWGVSIHIECDFFKIIYKQLDKEVGDEKKNHFEPKVFSSEARLEKLNSWNRGGKKELRYTKSEVGRTNFVILKNYFPLLPHKYPNFLLFIHSSQFSRPF